MTHDQAVALKRGDIVHFMGAGEHRPFRVTSAIITGGGEFICHRAEALTTSDVRFISIRNLSAWHLPAACPQAASAQTLAEVTA